MWRTPKLRFSINLKMSTTWSQCFKSEKWKEEGKHHSYSSKETVKKQQKLVLSMKVFVALLFPTTSSWPTLCYKEYSKLLVLCTGFLFMFFTRWRSIKISHWRKLSENYWQTMLRTFLPSNSSVFVFPSNHPSYENVLLLLWYFSDSNQLCDLWRRATSTP